uniref:NADH dehydrogenase subunit 2 n=1 Tax=Prionocidaris baculosa TaxID=1198993 RepID=UPI00165ED065|nr:NADH dehydrogenase subunit 2 [Prionocidaris baculosa]QLM01945.1 NADH dehydrogenase subunit 2 [Prionocidaris baculosa]
MHRLTSLFLAVSIILGTFIVVSSENWFIIWTGLELSTLALIPLLCANFTPRNVEAAIKYFLIQAISAALILNSALINAWFFGSWSILCPTNPVSTISLSIALAFKLGLAPCHFWFPDVLQGLPFIQGLIISTWQKIAPLILLFSFSQLVNSNLLILAGLISVVVGGWGGLNQTQVRKILAFSSIGHMGWIVITSFYSTNVALIMLFIYLVINTSIFLLAEHLNIFTLGHLNITSYLSPNTPALVIITILSLGGLPPLTGFMIKFFSLSTLIGNSFIILSSLLILGSLLSLFFYLRIAFNTSLSLFPQHILSLSSWRNNTKTSILPAKTWFLSVAFTVSTIGIPIIPPLYMNI